MSASPSFVGTGATSFTGIDGSIFSSSPIVNPILEQCIARIRKLVNEQVRLRDLYDSLSSKKCVITLEEPPDDPVVTGCKHLFDKTALKKWGDSCPMCREKIREIVPIPKRWFDEDHLGGPKKAALSRLCLSLDQLQEGNIPAALRILESCKEEFAHLKSLIAVLRFFCDSSDENIERAMASALEENDLETKIFIYKQILTSNPFYFDAYKQLSSLIQDLKEKSELLLTAADLAFHLQRHDLEQDFRKRADDLVTRDSISQSKWAAAKDLLLPSYPPELERFLREPCPFWPGKTRRETHIVVPLFPEAEDDGLRVPFTLRILNQFNNNSGGPEIECILPFIPPISADKEFHYAVMTKDVIPESRNKSYQDQIALLPEGYEIPGIFDAVRAILWENQSTGQRCFTDNPLTYTRCKENIPGSHFCVGGLNYFLRIGNGFQNKEKYGIAAWRKF